MDLSVHDELTCQVRDVLDRVGDKWSLNVVYELRDGSRRFTDLKRSIEGISQRMLTVTLRNLERDGLVERTVHAVVPPRVDYELTTMGQTLLKTAWELIDWAEAHAADIAHARAHYDRSTVTP
ncbi:helix-turn-helix domain-containing protein [Hamadaea sp.]|uniref:winged helix-turn-helix transcriptional regulator n=1 Tax=Hamadaea sp. TaxID=2024425 RepID=UPI0025BA0338|nr:helix-turn-helix domain-containing protein [Hamadaea sp.]